MSPSYHPQERVSSPDPAARARRYATARRDVLTRLRHAPAGSVQVLLVSLALLVAILVARRLNGGLAADDLLIWVVALVPGLLLAHLRRWRGVTIGLAGGMILLACAHGVLIGLGWTAGLRWVVLAIVATGLAVALTVGFVGELLQRERERAERLAMVDDLTGLPNRRLATRFLDIEVAAAQRGRRLTLVLIDLDHFKAVNDTHGHIVGDRALQLVGRTLLQCTRRMNMSARWGGEEFVSILSDTDASGALIFLQRVRQALDQVEIPGGPITFSAGLAQFGRGTCNAEELILRADEALYRAKAEGRDRAVVYQPTADLEADLTPERTGSAA
jgi:diguanylate cyclase (GGDEF)-like protein